MQNFCCKTFYVTLKTTVYFMHVGNGFLSPSPLSRERLFLVFYTAIFHVRFSFQCKKWPSIWWNKKFITVNQRKIEKRQHYPWIENAWKWAFSFSKDIEKSSKSIKVAFWLDTYTNQWDQLVTTYVLIESNYEWIFFLVWRCMCPTLNVPIHFSQSIKSQFIKTFMES